MRPTTIRRLIVVAVCSLGVLTLYLWPSPANSPVGGPVRATEPPVSAPANTRLPSAVTTVPATAMTATPRRTATVHSYNPDGQVQTGTPSPPASRRPTGSTPPPTSTASPRPTVSASQVPPTRSTPSTATPQPSPSATPSGSQPPTSTPTPKDTTPPTAPTNLRVTNNSGGQVSFAWQAASDNVGVVSYQISVLRKDYTKPEWQTNGTTITITWPFSADGNAYEVWVSAYDAAGNRVDSEAILVTSQAEPNSLVSPTPSEEPPQ